MALYALSNSYQRPSPIADRVIQLEKAGGGYDDYRRSIRAAVRGLWSGQIDLFGFLESMNGAIRRCFTIAWNEGAGMVGILSNELTDEETNALNIAINNNILETWGFGIAIQAKDKANGGKLAPLLTRAEMWINRYGEIVSQAMMMAGRDQKLRWVMNPLKEHCSSCLTLNGRVYRASIWAKYDLRPRMWRLRCHGLKCGCGFEVTSEPVTRGRPPAI